MNHDQADRDLDDLRLLVGVRDDVRLPPADQHRLYRELRQTLRRREIRRGRTFAIVGAVAIVSCVVSVMALVVLAVGGGRSGGSVAAGPVVHAAQPEAVDVLRRMSAAVHTEPVLRVGDGQFVYVRSTTLDNEGALGQDVSLSRPHTRELWLSQRPRGIDHSGLIREYGQDWPISSGVGEPRPGLYRPTYAWLASLPTDPNQLETRLRGDLRVVEGQEIDQALFEAIGGLISEGLVPPHVASALYDVAARIPGVELEPRAADAIGRVGIGIGRTDAHFGTRYVWVFQPGTAEILGTRSYFVSGPARRTMTLFGATAVRERAVVDREGQPPGAGT